KGPRNLRTRSFAALAGLSPAPDAAHGNSLPPPRRFGRTHPLADRSMDTIVMTWTGCSIPEIRTALIDMRRVLAIGGRLLFVGHGRAPEPSIARWQDRLDPLWLRFSGGGHLNRKIDDLLAEAGFRLDRLGTGYIAGTGVTTVLY